MATVLQLERQLGKLLSLVWDMEVVLLVEVQIPSLRIMKEADLGEDKWIQTRLDQLNLIDEKRLTVVYHGQMYQKCMIKAFNKKFRRQEYQVRDLVIKRIILPQSDPGENGLPHKKDHLWSRTYFLVEPWY